MPYHLGNSVNRTRNWIFHVIQHLKSTGTFHGEWYLEETSPVPRARSIFLSSVVPLLNFKECKLDFPSTVANDIKASRQGLQDVISRQASMTEGIVPARRASTFYEEKKFTSPSGVQHPRIFRIRCLQRRVSSRELTVTADVNLRRNCTAFSSVSRVEIVSTALNFPGAVCKFTVKIRYIYFILFCKFVFSQARSLRLSREYPLMWTIFVFGWKQYAWKHCKFIAHWYFR